MQSADKHVLITFIAAASFVTASAAIMSATIKRVQTPAEITASFPDAPTTFETIAKPRAFSRRFEDFPLSAHVEDRRDPLGEVFLGFMKAVRR
jgi:hypothetical protein